MRCPKCGTDCPDDYNFCELDGTALKAVVAPIVRARIGASCRCGAPISSPEQDGFCSLCGELWEFRNHQVFDMGTEFGAVSDRGAHHPRNEDSVKLSSEQFKDCTYHILVVCDGLSSAQRSSEASLCAASAAQALLSEHVRNGMLSDKQSAMHDAIIAAHTAVCSLEYDKQGQKDPPGTTIVAALLEGNSATIGWVGDSRAYLLLRESSTLITHDHSWINEAVESGEMAESEAMSSEKAHLITHCIGPVETTTSGTAPEPSVVSVELPPHSWLLLCSDGLWNYAPSQAEFDTVINSAPADANAIGLASHLVAFAIAAGGRDNITVALSQPISATESRNGIQG